MQNVTIPALFSGFAGVNVLCIGDVFLDEYIHGVVERISPEAPVPILKVTRERTQLGGAGNVAANIAALGAKCTLVSCVGTDAIGRDILRLLGAAWPQITPSIITTKARESITKVRFVSGSQQMLRVDREKREDLAPDKEDEICHMIDELVHAHDIVIISDYDKGILTPTVLRYTIETAKHCNKAVIVDPKLRSSDLYRDATVITPNRKEFDFIVPSSGDIVTRSRWLIKNQNVKAVLVTLSEAGISLVSDDDSLQLEALAHEIVDVSGAGDTVVAVLSIALAAGFSLLQSAELANIAAGVVVGKQGTASLNMDELIAAYEKNK